MGLRKCRSHWYPQLAYCRYQMMSKKSIPMQRYRNRWRYDEPQNAMQKVADSMAALLVSHFKTVVLCISLAQRYAFKHGRILESS